ncbi:MAG: hypothetical protein KZQ96_20735 [Candidatus Thiodiazotropha sp. (ex Lucinoma borealis)]|nr:hypothetical protein [Candidatus Thiodiazotropha sp. (ex Lucinoma borealis)]
MEMIRNNKIRWTDQLGWMVLVVSGLIGLLTVFDAKAITVTETGVGSAQNEKEENNLEELRLRAIRNALEVAVIRVSGVIISGERKDSLITADTVKVKDGVTTEKLKQDSIFHNTIVSRSNAYARLKKVIKEWRDGGQYYVQAKVDVREGELQQQMRNAGIYWARVGNPTIHIYMASNSGYAEKRGENYVIRYLRDTMARNGISVLAAGEEAAYRIPVTLRFSSAHVREFDTYKTSCSVSYEIIDSGVNSGVAAGRKAAGPEGGFSEAETRAKCEKKIVPRMAKDMVRQVTKEMNSIWNNGRKYRVSIGNLGSREITKCTELVRNIFRVSNVSDIRFNDDMLRMEVQYKGMPMEFVDNVIKTFEYEGRELALSLLRENTIEMSLIGKETD